MLDLLCLFLFLVVRFPFIRPMMLDLAGCRLMTTGSSWELEKSLQGVLRCAKTIRRSVVNRNGAGRRRYAAGTAPSNHIQLRVGTRLGASSEQVVRDVNPDLGFRVFDKPTSES